MAKATRKKKVVRLNGLLGIFSTLKADIPGLEEETLAAQAKISEYFLTEKEIEAAIEKEIISEDIAEEFVEFLQRIDCIKKSGSKSTSTGSGERHTTIDSVERAREVANDPTDEEAVAHIAEVMSTMVQMRNDLKPYIDQKAEVSIALKNKKAKEDTKTKEEVTDNVSEEISTENYE